MSETKEIANGDRQISERISDMESSVPKSRVDNPSVVRPFPNAPKMKAGLLLLLIVGVSILISFWLVNAAYNRKTEAEIPMKRIALYEPTAGIEAVSFIIGGISNARQEIVACIPIQYSVSQQIFKLLGKKAQDGVKVIVVMNDKEKNFISAKEYLNYYSGNKVVVAGLPNTIYTTTILLDGVYTIKIGAPIGSSMGKAPVCASLEVYKNRLRVEEEKKIMAAMQK